MSNVEFNEENNPSVLYAKFQSSREVPFFVKKLMDWGLAKSPQQANLILLTITILAFSITAFLIYKINFQGSSQFPREEIRLMTFNLK